MQHGDAALTMTEAVGLFVGLSDVLYGAGCARNTTVLRYRQRVVPWINLA